MEDYYCDYCDKGFDDKEEGFSHEKTHSEDESKLLHAKIPIVSDLYHTVVRT